MKDKLIATITLGLIFSLFFYYKVVNPNHENLVSSANNIDPVEEFVLEVINKEKNMLNEAIVISNSEETVNNTKDECSFDNIETDEWEFSAAFKYYRNCNGGNSVFNWKNKAYSTLMKSDIEDAFLLTDEEELNEDKNSTVDKKHLQLQSQMIGDNLK
tara:strand:+ start:132 stop:605 length:474 start_codon:yes stop_codon:yes gene_type:complete